MLNKRTEYLGRRGSAFQKLFTIGIRLTPLEIQ